MKRCIAAILAAGLASGGYVRGGLTHYWPFDRDASSYLADTAGGANGAAVGAAAQTTTAGQYVRGTGGLRIPHNTAGGDFVDVTTGVIPTANPCAFTICAWYRYEDIGTITPSDARNFVWETVANYTSGFGLRDASGARDAEWYYLGTVSDVTDQSGPVVNDGLWHHVAMVWDKPSGTVLYYHDGALRDTVAIAPGNDLGGQPTTGLHIGNHRAGDGARNWDGYIDDFAVFDHALSAEDVAKLVAGSSIDTLDDPPVRAAQVAIGAGPTYSVTRQTTGFNVTFRNANTGDHEVYARGTRLKQTDGIILGGANDGDDSIVQIGGDLTQTPGDARYDNGMAFATCDLSAGTEKNFTLAFAHFPFQREWVGAHVKADGTILAGPNLPAGTTVSKLAANAWRGPGHYVVHFPGASASLEGMLFVTGGENDDNHVCAGVFEDPANVDVLAGNAALGDWHVHIRNYTQNDTSDVGEDGAFSFLYLPYRSVNLIGGRIVDADQNYATPYTTARAVGTWTLENTSAGVFALQLPDGEGGYYTDADGVLLVQAGGILEDNSQDPVEGNVASWTCSGNTFTIKVFDAPSAPLQTPRELLFAFVRYDAPLQVPPPTQGTIFMVR